jgi:glutamate/tyrosine decarboxylase-like PLP-dependent enzyme
LALIYLKIHSLNTKHTDSFAAILDELAQKTAALDPGMDTWQLMMQETIAYTNNFITETRSGSAWQNYDVVALKNKQDFQLADEGWSYAQILEEIGRTIDKPGLNPASGGHLGYIPGGGILPAALGDFMAAVTNRYAGVAYANPGAVDLEHALVRWMADLFGFPKEAGGTLTSGGSIANLAAITAARDAFDLRPSQYEQCVIYGSPQMHHCLHKALRIAGLEYAILREVPLNERHQIDATLLESIIREDKAAGLKPFLIIGSVGTTDTGSIDPLDALADLAEKENLWLHLDAAYGGFFYMLDAIKPLMKGIERAHSIVVDPHKGLFLPYGTGAVIVRDIATLHRSFWYQANYMQDTKDNDLGYSPADISPELTRHFRGLRMYVPLKLFGLQAFRDCLEEKLMLCRYFHENIKSTGFETGPEPALSVTYFRYVSDAINPDEFNKNLVDFVRNDGHVFLSSTTINGVFWIRLAVLSFRTKKHHIDKALAVLKEGVLKLSPH